MAPKREWLERDYYAVLGVSSEASDDDIKKAYRKLANANHPDRNPDDAQAEERFKEINEAYSVVGKPDVRKEYDEIRRLGAQGFGAGPGFGGGAGPGGFAFEGGSFEDLFRSIFSDGGPGFQTVRRPAKGTDVRSALHLSFGDALAGVKTRLRVGEEEFSLRVPAGVKDGAVIRVPGRGGPGRNGGPRGDILVEVSVEPDRLFGRRGNDLTLDVDVAYTEAVLGAKIAIPLPDGGRTTIKVPAGTTSGQTFRVRDRGAPHKNGRGDLLVTVHISVPSKPSRAHKSLLNQLLEHDDTSAEREQRLFGDSA